MAVNFEVSILGAMHSSYLNSIHGLFSNDPLDSWRERSALFRVHSAIRRCLKMPFIINFSKIELEITSLCNLRCNNCDRACGQAPSSQEMSLEEIRQFISESIQHNKQWAKIAVQGGEPMLHTRIREVLEILVEYKRNFSPQTFIRLTTNGWGSKVQRLLREVPPDIFISNTEKVPLDDHGRVTLRGAYPAFDTAQYAALDVDGFDTLGHVDFASGCSITETCGIALTSHGYFPCGAGAAVARVFGLNLGVASLAEVTIDRFRTCLDSVCRYCGHFRARSRYADMFPTHPPKCSWYQLTSPSWRAALSAYESTFNRLSKS